MKTIHVLLGEHRCANRGRADVRRKRRLHQQAVKAPVCVEGPDEGEQFGLAGRRRQEARAQQDERLLYGILHVFDWLCPERAAKLPEFVRKRAGLPEAMIGFDEDLTAARASLFLICTSGSRKGPTAGLWRATSCHRRWLTRIAIPSVIYFAWMMAATFRLPA